MTMHVYYWILLLSVTSCFLFCCEGKNHRHHLRRHRNETEIESKSTKAGKLSKICEYQCTDGTCIQTKFVCDGWKDCDSDESTCTEYRCRGMDFSKLTGFNCNPLTHDDTVDEECIPYHMFCDGQVQCSNANDELYCDYFGEDELYDILTTDQ